MAAIWNSPWDTNNEWYNKMLASGQYWNDWDLANASQDRWFADEVFNAKSDYANATTDEARALANQRAEAARSKYNYNSGTAGAEYNPYGSNGVATPGGTTSFWGGEMMSNYGNVANYQPFSYQPYQQSDRVENSRNALANYGSFNYAPYVSPVDLSGRISAIENVDPFQYEEFKAPDPFTYEKYENTTPDFQHSDYYNDALANVQGYGDFAYDYTTDPLYDVYKKEYTREGQRAQRDALAQAAAMTGGVPSSYANTAAQQAGNYYMAQLADKIPELRAQAYNEWQNNYNMLRDKYNAATTHDQFDYGMYKDKLNQDYQQYLDDLNMRYNIYSDDYNRAYQQWGDKTNLDYQNWRDNYNKLMDLYNMDFQQDQTAYGRYSDDYNRAYQGWKDDYGRLMDMYNIDVDADNTAYNRWANDRDFDYGVYQDNYSKALDRLDFSNNNYWKMYGEDLDAAQREDEKRLDYAKLLAGLGDYSGYTDYYGDTRAADAYAALLAAQAAKGSGRGTPKQDTRLTIPQSTWDEIFASANMDDTGKSALESLTQYWDFLSDNQRDELARLGGIDADDLAALGGATKVGLGNISDYADLMNPQPLSRDDFSADPNLVMYYGTYENYLKGVQANSTNGGFGSGYGPSVDANGVTTQGLYSRMRGIMDRAGNDIDSKKDAEERVKTEVEAALGDGLTEAGAAYILQALGIAGNTK